MPFLRFNFQALTKTETKSTLWHEERAKKEKQNWTWHVAKPTTKESSVPFINQSLLWYLHCVLPDFVHPSDDWSLPVQQTYIEGVPELVTPALVVDLFVINVGIFLFFWDFNFNVLYERVQAFVIFMNGKVFQRWLFTDMRRVQLSARGASNFSRFYNFNKTFKKLKFSDKLVWKPSSFFVLQRSSISHWIHYFCKKPKFWK